MRVLLRLILWTLALALLALGGIVVSAFLDSRPLVPQTQALTASDRAWARQWLAAASPRGRADGERVTLRLTAHEANLLAGFLIEQLGQGRVAVELAQGQARLAASLGLPWDPEGSFVNLDLTLAGGGDHPRITKARVAGLRLPAGLAERLAEQFMAALDRSRLLQRVDIEPAQVVIVYEWHREALAQVGSSLVSAEDRARLGRYHQLLVKYLGGPLNKTVVSLAEPLGLVMRAAGRAGSGNPITENRAAILALAAYVNRQTIPGPETGPAAGPTREPPPPHRPVTLHDREDLAQHFMTSAALAAQGGAAAADLAGLLKEVSDSRGGSGFSFADLAADRAGSRFGTLATTDPEWARALQMMGQPNLRESYFMPSIRGLPEGLDRRALIPGPEGTQSGLYQGFSDLIDHDIAALPLYR